MGVIENFKDVLRVADTLNNLDLYKKLSELQTAVFALEEENRSLKEQLNIKNTLTFEDEKYWLERNGQKEGPFCTVCWDIDSKLVRMRSYQLLGVDTHDHICDFCSRHRNKGHSKAKSGD